jgi:cytochrome b
MESPEGNPYLYRLQSERLRKRLLHGSTLRITMSEKIRVWDLPVRMFHWLLAGSFVAAYLVAESERLRGAHVILGYTATGLIVFRIVWGLVGSHFARFRSFLFAPSAAIGYLRSLTTEQPRRFIGHNPAGSYAIYAILLAGLATGLTGYLSLNEIGGESVEDLHEVCANIWLGVVIVHIVGVVLGSWIHRENLVRSMITGYKEGVQGKVADGESGVPAGRTVGIAVAAGVAAVWIWGLLTGTLSATGGERASREQRQEQGPLEKQQLERREASRLAAKKPDGDD